MNKNYSLSELPEIAKEIINKANNKVLLFYGDMGVGKTTLIKEICKQLGVKEVTHSPTFSLVNEYQTKNNESVYHFDFYRIENEEEAYDMGFEDYFYTTNYCLVEWPEKIKNLLPLDATEIHIHLKDDEQRTIQLKNQS